MQASISFYVHMLWAICIISIRWILLEIYISMNETWQVKPDAELFTPHNLCIFYDQLHSLHMLFDFWNGGFLDDKSNSLWPTLGASVLEILLRLSGKVA